MTSGQEMACLPGRQALSPLEDALLHENSSLAYKPQVGRVIAVLTVLLFAAMYAPVAQTAEIALDSASLLEILNQDRIKYGLAPLESSTSLEQAALAKAQDILSGGYFAHISPAGREPWDFIKAVGFKYSFAGENLAINYTSSFELHNDFMASEHHRENLLSPLFSTVGIAVVEGSFQGKSAVITVQMFARPQRLSASDGGQASPLQQVAAK